VRIQKLETTDAFIILDLDSAEASLGIVRLAPKILVDGAEMLARSNTYAFASFGLRSGGASAGINAKPDGRTDAIKAFETEVAPLVASGSLVLYPGNGLTDEDLAPLGERPVSPDAALTARGIVAAAEAAVGGLDGKSFAIEGGGPVADAARAALTDAGLTAVDGGIDAAASILLVAGKSGAIDHERAATVQAEAVVPLTPLPITAKAYATLSRAGIVYVPDFLALAAPLLARLDGDAATEPVERVRASVAELADQGVNLWRAAITRAETFLSTWQDALPYGRPLSS
jgi:glutamate dehydrogenase/leucine dehydrogenase